MKQKKTVKAVKAATRLVKYCGKRPCTKCIFFMGFSGEYPICALKNPCSWLEIKGGET